MNITNWHDWVNYPELSEDEDEEDIWTNQGI